MRLIKKSKENYLKDYEEYPDDISECLHRGQNKDGKRFICLTGWVAESHLQNHLDWYEKDGEMFTEIPDYLTTNENYVQNFASNIGGIVVTN